MKERGYPIASHPVVSQLAQLNITGDVIPRIWNKQICRADGKPYDIAVRLLADIVFWYRPVEVYDEVSGALVETRKRFKADKIQRDYAMMGEEYGYTKNQVRDALAHLAGMGLIDLEFRHPYVAGRQLGNVLYIGLDPVRLKEITFPTGEAPPPPRKVVQSVLFLPGEAPDWQTIEHRDALKLPEISLYRKITGRIPGQAQFPLIYDAIRQIGLTRAKIEPFWKAHLTRGGKVEALYWLTEWAVAEKVTPPGNGNGHANGSKPADTAPKGDAALKAWRNKRQGVNQ